MPHHEGQIGTRDEAYDLVSVLYHCLQSAETCTRYIQDAEKAGSTELVQFFRDCIEEDKRRAERCKGLLMQCLGESTGTMGKRRAA